jgi:hypothetical protein
MKQRRIILGGLAAFLAAFALLFVLVPPQPRISLTFGEYQRWPHGATLLLSNGTQNTIRYVSQANETPAGDPVLCLQKTPTGWTNSSPAIRSVTGINPTTRKTTELLYLANPAALPKPGDFLSVLQPRELAPGRSVVFFVRMEPGGLPRKVGTVCYVPQSPLEKKLRPWLERLQQWCKMKASPPGQREIWCPTELSMPAEPDYGERN